MDNITKYSKEWWAERLPLIQAFAEGKTIQYHCDCNGRWYDSCPDSTLQLDNPIYEYRVKPDPKYRAYYGIIDFTKDMAKHGYMIEYRPTDGSSQWRTRSITDVSTTGVWLSNDGFVSYDGLINPINNEYRWLDDCSPCGVDITNE